MYFKVEVSVNLGVKYCLVVLYSVHMSGCCPNIALHGHAVCVRVRPSHWQGRLGTIIYYSPTEDQRTRILGGTRADRRTQYEVPQAVPQGPSSGGLDIARTGGVTARLHTRGLHTSEARNGAGCHTTWPVYEYV